MLDDKVITQEVLMQYDSDFTVFFFPYKPVEFCEIKRTNSDFLLKIMKLI